MDGQPSRWRHYAVSDLALRSDPSGARFWAVALERAMLTYFEVPPDCRFETHRHESEQITFVLEGELHFELEGVIRCVGAGEVLAIPSNVPHAVYTDRVAATAVDAWSPPAGRYESGAVDPPKTPGTE